MMRSSKARMVLGIVGMVLAIGVFVVDDTVVADRLFGWTSFLFLAALLLFGIGIEGMRRKERRRREIDRALGEWDSLRLGMAGRPSPAQFLRQRGYRQFEVRRWIEREVARGPAGAQS